MTTTPALPKSSPSFPLAGRMLVRSKPKSPRSTLRLASSLYPLSASGSFLPKLIEFAIVFLMFIKLFLQSLLAFLLIDSLWITQVASPWMKKVVPHLMSATPNLLAAGLFYLIYLSALLSLILIPALNSKLPLSALLPQAFLFGFAAYATYDLTNLAVMRGYPWSLALADMFWGGLLTLLTVLIVYKLNVR